MDEQRLGDEGIADSRHSSEKKQGRAMHSWSQRRKKTNGVTAVNER